MADWLLLAHAGADASGVAFDLYGYGTPGDPAPLDAWYIRRTAYTASALGSSATQTITFASWATNAGLTSATAWTGRAGLTYGSEIVPATYAGDPALVPTPSTSAGGSMNALIGTPTYLIINKSDGWIDITATMTVDGYYEIQPVENDVAAMIAADAVPTDDTLAVKIGRGEASELWKFTGQPIWASTDDAQARLRVFERG